MKKVLIVLALALIAVPSAGAADTDRVQVAGRGQNSTRGFPAQTFVAVTSPENYRRVNFDGDAGNWRGPPCIVSWNPSFSKDVNISWSVGFSDAYRSAEEAAEAFTSADTSIFRRGTLDIPHRIRGKSVGDIQAYFVLAQYQGEDGTGWAELGLGIPLTRGIFVDARFWATGPSFDCNVGALPGRAWHRDALLITAERGVVIDGNLPAARLTAHAQRRRVAGFVSDGFGHPVVGVRVFLERRVGRGWRRAGAATTNASGFYSALSLSGLVRAAHGSLRSKAVRVR